MAKPNRGLGNGLQSLLGDAALFDTSPNDFVYIQLSKIEPRHNQPRMNFETEPLEELAASIREHGILSPITVRSSGDGFYQIIAGERRWRAARMAELVEVPARIVEADDRTVVELSLIENLQRENLNPIEEAAGYRELGEDFGLTQEEIAQRMGKSRPVITNALRLLTLPDELLKLVRSGELPPGSARALLAIHDRQDMLSAAKEVVTNGLSTREVEKLARRVANKERSDDADIPTGSTERKINYMQEFEQSLGQALGRRVRIVAGRHNNGRFELEFYGEDDFERLYNNLSSLKLAPIGDTVPPAPFGGEV